MTSKTENEKIACNNWEKIGYLKAKQDFSLALKEFEDCMLGIKEGYTRDGLIREIRQLLHLKLGKFMEKSEGGKK